MNIYFHEHKYSDNTIKGTTYHLHCAFQKILIIFALQTFRSENEKYICSFCAAPVHNCSRAGRHTVSEKYLRRNAGESQKRKQTDFYRCHGCVVRSVQTNG